MKKHRRQPAVSWTGNANICKKQDPCRWRVYLKVIASLGTGRLTELITIKSRLGGSARCTRTWNAGKQAVFWGPFFVLFSLSNHSSVPWALFTPKWKPSSLRGWKRFTSPPLPRHNRVGAMIDRWDIFVAGASPWCPVFSLRGWFIHTCTEDWCAHIFLFIYFFSKRKQQRAHLHNNATGLLMLSCVPKDNVGKMWNVRFLGTNITARLSFFFFW